MQLYQFQIKQAGNYQIHTTGRSDTVCWLLNPQSAQLQLLAYDDDSGVRKNCALTRQLKPGTHLAVITGSYFGRGPYRVGLKKARQPGVKFKALTFGEPVKDRIYNPKQGHRFRFTLAKDARVTFIAAMSRTSPQMFILDASGNQLYSGGYPSNKRRKMWVFSRMLKAGQYYLDLRASGNPRSSYQLLAQVENQVSLPANKARPLRDGMGKHQDKTPFTQSTFVVALNKNEYNSIEANHPRLLGCYLETDQGELVASAFRGVAKSKRCRLAGMNRTGKFFLRIIARKAISRRRALRRRRRLSYSERRRLRRERFRRLLRRLRRMRRRRRTARNFRRLYQDPPSRRTAKPKARKKPKATIRVAKHKPMILPLVNSFKGATVRFVQTHPQTLPINKSFATKAKGHLVFQVDVPKDDLYWFSGRGTGIKHCALKHVFTGAVKQSNIAEGGCDVAAYLLRGTYMFALQSSRKGNRISWRTYRSMPSIIGTQPIVVGPVKKGQKLSYTVRITKAGYYQLKSTSTSSVPLKLKLELKKGTRTTLRPSSILYKHKLMGYLTPGSYNLRVAVTTGRGAYTLTKSLLPSRTLAANRPLKGQIRKRREKHYYNVNLTSSGWYVFETTGKMDTYCSLYNRSNRRIAYNDDSGVKRNCRIVKQLTAGRYALQIRSILGRVGKYQVKYKKTTALRARRLRRRRRRRRRFGTSGHAAYRRYRYSSGRTTRATIQLNKLYRGVLRNKRDVNLYTVNIRRAGRYIFETKGPLNGSDTKCYMYKGTRRIAYNDDSGYRLHCKIVTRLTPGRYKVKVILALSTRAGPYHFAMRPYGSAWPTSRGRLVARGGTTTRRPVRARPRTRRRGNGNNARRQLLGVIGSRRSRRNRRTKPRGVRGRYRLGTMRRGTTTRRSTKRPPMSRRSPLQIVAGRAMTLRPGLRTQAMTVTQTRIDVYQLAIPRAGTYIIQTHGALDTKCYLDDARGGVLAVNEDSGYTANCRIQLRLPYGTYTLRVLARPVGRMGPYGLSLKLKAD